MASPISYPHIKEKRYYKKLITDLARELTETEIKEVAFHNSIKAKEYKDALDLFTLLEKREVIGNYKISALAQIFENVQRKDLVTKLLETATKMEGRVSQSLKLPQPERLDVGIDKRSHTVSGIPISNIRATHQETQDRIFTVGDTQQESGELEKKSSQLSIANSHELPSNETREHDQSQYCDDRLEESYPSSGNRSRHISEYIDPGTCNYQSSRSGTRSPSLHNTTSHSASGYHSISDLSIASTHNIPTTEDERQYVLLHKVLELLEKKSPISKGVVNDRDQNPKHDESETEDKLSQPTEVAPNPKLKVVIKRNSRTDSDGTLESSHESCQEKQRRSKTIQGATAVSPASPTPRTQKLERRTSLRVSNLLRKPWKRIGRAREGYDSVQWTVKRDQLNKMICRHQEDHTISCKKKIEVDVGNGSTFNPKLTLMLRPYGLEEDTQRYVTLEIHIDVPKKAPKLKEFTSVRLVLTISKLQSEEKAITMTENLALRVFYRKKFISHRVLRESKSDVVEITAQAECVRPSD